MAETRSANETEEFTDPHDFLSELEEEENEEETDEPEEWEVFSKWIS